MKMGEIWGAADDEPRKNPDGSVDVSHLTGAQAFRAGLIFGMQSCLQEIDKFFLSAAGINLTDKKMLEILNCHIEELNELSSGNIDYFMGGDRLAEMVQSLRRWKRHNGVSLK